MLSATLSGGTCWSGDASKRQDRPIGLLRNDIRHAPVALRRSDIPRFDTGSTVASSVTYAAKGEEPIAASAGHHGHPPRQGGLQAPTEMRPAHIVHCSPVWDFSLPATREDPALVKPSAQLQIEFLQIEPEPQPLDVVDLGLHDGRMPVLDIQKAGKQALALGG